MVWSNHPHCSEDTEASHPPQAQKFSDEDPSKEDRYIHVYEPLENFSKVYEEINPNESLFSTREADVTVNKVTKICEASPSSNQSTIDIVNVIDEKSLFPWNCIMKMKHQQAAIIKYMKRSPHKKHSIQGWMTRRWNPRQHLL